jgi:transcriptional regulator with GAF, ATPase, and Fis domain
MNNESTALIVGEDTGMSSMLSTLGLRPIVVGGPQEALTQRQNLLPSLVLLNLPGGSLEPRFLDAVSRGGVPVLLLADPDASFGKVSRKNGKNGRNGKIRVLTRPVRDGELQAAVRTLLEGPSSASWDQAATTGTLLGERYLAEYAPLLLHSQKMRAVKEIIEQVADTNATVLIRGESGVGKDIVARAIHYASPRRSHPFVKVNCATFPMDLLESELFGHEKGAFTGAYQKTLGKFELANKGTFFLDEIGELPVGLQAKLLHVLQDHEFSRVGGRQMIHVDTRVIASTNRDLEIALTNGQFREDLYYRLNVVEIHVPPLRQRREEIPILAMSFLDKFNQQDDRKVKLSPETITLFTEYSWPGNVRELENTILRLVVLGSVPQIHEEILNRLRSLPPKQSESKDAQAVLQPLSTLEIPLGLREVARRAAQEAERRAIREVLDRVHWNRSVAARLLKVSYKTLLSKIHDCGLTPKRKPVEPESPSPSS